MNSRIAKKLTVTLFEVLDYNSNYVKYKAALKSNISDFMRGINNVAFLDVYKVDSRLIFVAVEAMPGVAQEPCYKYLFECFGGIHNVEVNVPAAIIKITGDNISDYKLFIDNEMMKNAL